MMLNFLPQGPSMWLLGRFAAGFSAPNALLMLIMRALIPHQVPPQQPNVRSLDLGIGVMVKTVLMMLFWGAAWGAGNPPVVGISCKKASPEAERLEKTPHRRARAVAGGSNVGRCPI